MGREGERMKALFARFVREESGQDLIEYGLLVGIITAGAVLAINAIGPKVTTYYSTLETRLP
jgi:pilus assembly protein Flp/PilA